MQSDRPDLAGAPWLTAAPVQRIFALLADPAEDSRIIGGAVRNALMGRAITDIDFATTLTPQAVMDRAAGVGVRAVPTGIDHGTVTLVVDGAGHEVTTLREDVETDGRHAVVRFGRDWEADARRRDFTMNTLSVDATGRVFDPVGGYPDVVARRVTFVGDPDVRIAEDRLRALRLFRFHAVYGRGELSMADYIAAVRARRHLAALSAERVGAEMRKLLVAPGAAPAVRAMQDGGIFAELTGGVGYVGTLARLRLFEDATGREPAFAPRLAAAAVRVSEDLERLVGRLRLSNVEVARMSAVLAVAEKRLPADERSAFRRLYRHGEAAYRDGLAVGFARRAVAPDERAMAFLALPDRRLPPRFPISGADVVALGVAAGPAVGRLLAALERWWIERDFAPDRKALCDRLRDMVGTA